MVTNRDLETLLDLSKYQPTHEDGAVVAWPKRNRHGSKKDIDIEITASQLKQAPEGSPVEGGSSQSEEPKAEETGKAKDEL